MSRYIQRVVRKWRLRRPPPSGEWGSTATRETVRFIQTGEIDLLLLERNHFYSLVFQATGRTVIELPLHPDQWKDLVAIAIPKAILTSTAWEASDANHSVRINIYDGIRRDLTLMTVEFATTALAESFTLQEWAEGAVEVTDDPDYSERKLCFGPLTDS